MVYGITAFHAVAYSQVGDATNHRHHDAETYYEVGHTLGTAMMEPLRESANKDE